MCSQGVLVGVLASMIMLVHALNNPDIRIVSHDGGVLVVRVVGSFYFANIQRVRRRLLELVDASEEPPQLLVLEMSAVSGIDVTALGILPLFDRELEGRGVTLHLAALNRRPLALLRRSPAHAVLGERIHDDAGDALWSGDVPVR